MGCVTFDTQEFIETPERSGFKPEQAKAISTAVRKSHEVADPATKRYLDHVHKDLSFEVRHVSRFYDGLTRPDG